MKHWALFPFARACLCSLIVRSNITIFCVPFYMLTDQRSAAWLWREARNVPALLDVLIRPLPTNLSSIEGYITFINTRHHEAFQGQSTATVHFS
ncbi:uncharacterized protein LAESUDRAFT_23206 [Laetiporus sulphureus 93-53]|uniref:Uncharacterized protein n=1 Tax=Laetiporus sulphureus 93-53 TaxID=1314785 RepID=A0A165IEQ8_9APHY|nr:uncharacterized protein LAESUDRAFT_23206 [Laetiporus sulphureus 93-53]KZT12974.1 hypothetical protein LAESUDRAFT_23206 [Laetiporus sulphureus 93-53]